MSKVSITVDLVSEKKTTFDLTYTYKTKSKRIRYNIRDFVELFDGRGIEAIELIVMWEIRKALKANNTRNIEDIKTLIEAARIQI